MDTYAYDHGLPCLNPHCKSHGKPHPNCLCYSGGGKEFTNSPTAAEHYFGYAKGGSVCASNMKHLPGCEYYVDGGPVPPPLYADGGEVHEHHAAIHHGLLGLLTEAGRANVADSMSHIKTMGKLKGHLGSGEKDKAINLMHGHTLMGGLPKAHMDQAMDHLTPSIISNDSHPEALKASSEFINHSIKSHGQMEGHIKSVIGQKSNERIKPDVEAREKLKQHLEDLSANPSKLLDIGGDMGHYMPMQSAKLGALASTSLDYFNTIKPKPMQNAPLDSVTPPDKLSQEKFNRQIDIAQKPSLIFQHVKDGTLQSSDIVTIKTLYPGLYQSILKKANEAIIDASYEERQIPYKQKRSLSMLLGQPLDTTMSSQAMQAIIRSQGPQQAYNQARAQQKKPGNAELSQINKVNAMSETTLESRQINRKS